VALFLISKAQQCLGGFSSRLAVLCMLCLCGLGNVVFAQTLDPPDVERQVKAAYLYKFGSYVEWPERAFVGPENTVKVGIIGASALADELSQMVAGRTINGRQISVRKVRSGEVLTAFNVLFIGSASNDKLGEILATTKGLPILTVTEAADGLAQGSIINFVVVDGKVRFEVAPKTAHLGNLNISARLLAAAFKVAGT
jgi:hypothetical protein